MYKNDNGLFRESSSASEEDKEEMDEWFTGLSQTEQAFVRRIRREGYYEGYWERNTEAIHEQFKRQLHT